MTSEVESSNNTALDAATLEYLGLSADPFEGIHTPFYEGSGRGKMLIELLHQSAFAGQLLVVVGEEGVGKTSLLTAFCERLETGDRAEVIDVPFLSDASSILRELERRLELPTPGDLANFDARVAAIRRAVQRVGPEAHLVLAFDDAHHLDRDSLALVTRFADGSGPADPIRVFLSGEPGLVSRLAQLSPAPAAIRTFVLEPLSPEDLKSYLRLRLSAAGYSGIFPFKGEDIERLWSVSAGNPGAIHEPARQLLSALAAPPPEAESFGLPVAHMSAVTILVGVLLIALFSRSPSDEVEPAIARANSVGTSAVLDPSATAADPEPVNAASVAGHPNSAGAIGKAENPRQSVPQPVEAEVASIGPAPEAELPRPTPAPASQAEQHPVLARPPGRYALQVMAVGSAQAAREFVGRQPNAGELSVIKAQRQGKILHIVIVGDYASQEQARAAVARLPSEQRKAGPWPRSFASIQADMQGSGE